MKYSWQLYLYIFFSLFLFSTSAGAQASGKKFVVVIDPGHGGKDPGAVGRSIREKNINLSVALKLGALIRQNNSDVKVVYTRDRDVFVELQERANIANRAKADLFISVHTNASPSNSAYGTETYTLGLARTEENLRVAKRENSVILLEDDFSKRYEGFDPSSTESYIMFEFLQDKHLEQSINLASSIQKQFRYTAQRTDRGVRQAGFLVLRNTGMPSVLIEVGYISNPVEEAYLGSESGLDQIARSVYNAFSDYKSDYDRKQRGVVSKNKGNDSSEVAPVSRREEPSIVARKEKEPSGNDSVAEKPVVSISKSKGEVVYKIQIMVAPKKYGEKNACFKGLSPVSYFREGGLYKYTYGETTDRKKLLQELTKVRKLFKDAFIISFKDNEKQ